MTAEKGEEGFFPAQEKKGKKKEGVGSELAMKVTSLGSRLRMLETQYVNLRSRAQVIDQNLLEFERNVRKELKALSEQLLELTRTLQGLKEKVNIVSSELSNTVKEHDFRVLEKYVDLWNPGLFVTKEKLREAIEEALKQSRQG